MLKLMTTKFLTRAVLLATTVSMAVTTLPVSTAAAQGYNQPPPSNANPNGAQPYNQGGDYGDQNDDQGPPDGNYGPGPNDEQGGPPPGYQGGPPPGYQGNNGPPPDYNGPPPSDYANRPPPGYNGASPPPPPPGYNGQAQDAAQQAQDQRYAQYAERWAQENCVRAHGDVGAGAFLGGVFGALIGAGASGGRPGAVVAGAAIGGVSGAAIANSAGGDATSPGCPRGYVIRGGAPNFYYAGGPYYYAAPGWYNPWVWGGGAWVFRPYPYHAWYYHNYWRGGWHGGYHGGYWRGGYHHWR
jgi:hypothetical protein